MDNPGIFSLGDFTITAAGTQTRDWTTDLEGTLSLSFQARFAYGSGGTTTRVYLQTSFDQGTTAVDIACILFETAGEVKLINLSGLTPKSQTVPTDGAMSDDTLLDGFLGDRFRVKIISTGTYAGQTTLSTRIMAR